MGIVHSWLLSGVHRGLSFWQEGGPTTSQTSRMIGLFSPVVLSLIAPRKKGLAALLMGYIGEVFLAPGAAKKSEAPKYFGRLGSVQLAIPIACLLVLLVSERG